jgi:hypothetical protein
MENFSETFLSSLNCRKYLDQEAACLLSQKLSHWELKHAPNTMTCFNIYCCPVLADGILKIDYYMIIMLGLANFLMFIGLVLQC